MIGRRIPRSRRVSCNVRPSIPGIRTSSTRQPVSFGRQESRNFRADRNSLTRKSACSSIHRSDSRAAGSSSTTNTVQFLGMVHSPGRRELRSGRWRSECLPDASAEMVSHLNPNRCQEFRGKPRHTSPVEPALPTILAKVCENSSFIYVTASMTRLTGESWLFLHGVFVYAA